MIHATAIVEPGAKLADGVSVGAYSIIGKDVTTGERTWIGPHVTIEGRTKIGRNNRIYQFSAIGGPPQDKKYAGEDTASTIETVVRDPGAASVSVVVIDLAGAVVDDGFGAVALERIIDTVQGWGAEAVLTGLSPLSERVVASLAGDPIVVPKDLRNAIATAFRIAESQRRAL